MLNIFVLKETHNTHVSAGFLSRNVFTDFVKYGGLIYNSIHVIIARQLIRLASKQFECFA